MVMRVTNRRRLAGFTLIELLVVIAIIALLSGILLPALGRARTAGQLAVSLSNNRQISLATEQYRADNDGNMPWYQLAAPGWIGFCPWTYGGKHGDDEWRTQPEIGRLFDVTAHDRPLNKYLYADLDWDASKAGMIPRQETNFQTGETFTRYYARPAQRESLDLPVYRSPADKSEYLWFLIRSNQSPITTAAQNNEFGKNSYDFNGTSYMSNLKWWQLATSTPGSFTERFRRGMSRFRTGADFNPSQFVTLTDETGLAISYYGIDGNPDAFETGFGDQNKSVNSFFDGHAKYMDMQQGAFKTSSYSMIFSLPGERELVERLQEEYAGIPPRGN